MKKKGIYVLPTTFTLLNLSLGFFAIIEVFKSNFSNAAWAIVACHFCDVLDGRVARMTNTTSSFGIEFDSFADWISFGIAPAIMMHQLILYQYGKLGFIIALLFVISSCLRLARFNVKSLDGNNISDSYFVGLPTPAAGGILAAFVLVYQLFYQEITAKTIPLLMQNVPIFAKSMPLFMFFLSIAMVSQVKWNNFKMIKFSRPKPFSSLVIVLIFGLLIYVYPENFIFLLYLAYIVWGLLGFVLRFRRFKGREIKNEKR
ncbi:MAG: CDP-diacylglycerol--serine O-phosphatidyltransferase [bacterium]